MLLALWAEANLEAGDPHQLQDEGVNVYFAPNISPDLKVVNLANESIELFMPEEERPLGATSPTTRTWSAPAAGAVSRWWR